MREQKQSSQDRSDALIIVAVLVILIGVVVIASRLKPQPAPDGTPANTSRLEEVGIDDDPMLGAVDAPVTMIVFSDYRCGFCRSFERDMRDALLESYAGTLRIVFRDYPILGRTSVDAAVAAECADEQHLFWEYHDRLFNSAQVGRDIYIALASELGLDAAAFTTCYDDRATLAEIEQDIQDGHAAGVALTPTFYINGRYISGTQTYNVFARIIEEEQRKAGA